MAIGGSSTAWPGSSASDETAEAGPRHRASRHNGKLGALTAAHVRAARLLRRLALAIERGELAAEVLDV